MRFTDAQNPVERLALAVAVQADHQRPLPLLQREEMVRHILQTAADAGVQTVATKPDGEAERLLGLGWPFPSPFKVTVRTVPLLDGVDRAEMRARRSLEHMGLPRGDTVLVQAATDLVGEEGRTLWSRLQGLRDRGLFRRIGIICSIDDAPVVLARRFKPDVIQLSCNVLDQRAQHSGVIEQLAELGVAVHLSSVFAKGLLFASIETLSGETARLAPKLSRVRRRMAEARVDPMQAALAYALNIKGVENVIAKVNSPAQLRAIIAASHAPCPDVDWQAFALDDSFNAQRFGVVTAA